MRIDLRWALLVLLGAALAPSCQRPRDDQRRQNASSCSACHGDAARGGSELERAAPPRDLAGNTLPAQPGVGAHQIHLRAGATHGPVACSECHVVPEKTGDLGHADDPLPAELVFGARAKLGNRAPSYDPASGRCTDSYCHRGSDAAWTLPRASDAACGTCHGLPPPAPHPQRDACHSCHGEVMGQSGFVNAALHVDGKVQLGNFACDACHGGEGDPAPPRDLAGNTAVSALGVGAHRVHLAGGAAGRAVACGECHQVPAQYGDPGHADSDSPAEVIFSGVALSKQRSPSWDRQARVCSDAWCHSPSAPAASPPWTSDAGRLPCTGCHAMPPPAPHLQMAACGRCHGAVVGDDHVTIKDRSKHIDGNVDVVVPTQCNGCHGGANDAPPTDLSGSASTTSPGVGAHQAHLAGNGRARAVPCAECHVLPKAVNDPGHLDGAAPAELVFAGVALTAGASPSYSSGTCGKSYCHGAAFPGGAPSGGKHTAPKWTVVDGSQTGCDGCHALPPPAPHIQSTACWFCHKNVDSTLKFLFPDTHVDGLVTGAVP
jgi:predicted CxxxxCH...CXXCH cytochrome family protein